MTDKKYCCDVFKYYVEMDPIVKQDGLIYNDGMWSLRFEGVNVVKEVKHCFNCGLKLDDN